MKIILGAVAALMLSVAALSSPAQAACWNNGWAGIAGTRITIGTGAITVGAGTAIAGSYFAEAAEG